MPVAQVNNPQMKDILDSEFQRSSDPSFLHRIAVSKYLNLPGIRGFWGPAVRFSTQGGLLYATDMTGGGYHMVWTESLPVFYSELGYLAWYLDGVSDYASSPDCLQWDILASAAETWVGYKGIAAAAWICPTRVVPFAANEGILSKFLIAGNQRSWLMYRDNTIANNLSVGISSDGANLYLFDHTKTIQKDVWQFVAFTYNPAAVLGEAAGVRIWVNDTMEYHAAADARGTAGFPASIFNSTAEFQAGCTNAATNPYQGYMTDWFLCGNYLLESEIFNVFETTKTVFGFANEKGSSW
jgi:hypothetical protein